MTKEHDQRTQKPDRDGPLQEGPLLDQYVGSLIEQWKTCIKELRQLHVEATASASVLPIYGLYSLLKVQQRALDKAIQKNEVSQKDLSVAHYFGIKSCCWDDKWAVVKKCRSLVCVNKEFPRSPRQPVPPGQGWLAHKDKPFQEKEVVVDAVVDNGATWLRFISIATKRLEYQVLTEGYESQGEDENDDEDGAGKGLIHTEFVDTVKKLVLAARWNHCPHIHLLLPSLHEGESEVVNSVLDYLRNNIGGDDVSITISCAGSPFLADPPPPVDVAITALVSGRDRLVRDDCQHITPTANLDPSVLLSLVTDLHHGAVPLQSQAQQHVIIESIKAHETERKELVSRKDILAEVLFPALRGRKLVCTRFTASYFRQVISAIATHSEEVLASIILPPDDSSPSAALAREDRLTEFQKWSTVPVPPDLLLPIEIVDDIDLQDVEPLIAAGRLPPMARGVAHDLSRLNRSVYLYGWANRLTTITGHRGIERQILLSIATHWTRGWDERPPDIWHRHLGGYLVHRDKPTNWRDMIPGAERGDTAVPREVMRWTYPWTTWGRGISTYGVPDTKAWDGVGHDDMQGYGRRMERRERNGTAAAVAEEQEQEEEEQQEADDKEEEE